jgi:hypothetical protein
LVYGFGWDWTLIPKLIWDRVVANVENSLLQRENLSKKKEQLINEGKSL